MTRSIRRLSPLLGLLVLVAAAVAPSASRGQTAAPNPALNGTWRLSGSLQQAQQIVATAVEPAVSPLAPDIQRMARARIAETTWVPQTIQIAVSDAQIEVTIAGEENRTFATPPGTPQNVYSRSGVRAALTQQFRPDGGIEQRLQAMDGTQHNFYTPNGNQLYLDVLMQARRLHQDVRFRLTYTR